MNEIIKVGGESYAATNVSTGINMISFMLSDLTEDEAKTAFENVKSLSVGDENETYGEYPDVEFESITIGADDTVTVTMHIPTKMEKQLRDLQETVFSHGAAIAEHDEAITAMMFGGELE